ncbi:hypothetical protein [Neobacillus drentensis]|uniref:hypothetical protein n=1 Tax=Neobacillus drentensis TaxID=220684 RepID=UPI0008249E72|nr:hypothetical protein [Neobacillus drentensis]
MKQIKRENTIGLYHPGRNGINQNHPEQHLTLAGLNNKNCVQPNDISNVMADSCLFKVNAFTVFPIDAIGSCSIVALLDPERFVGKFTKEGEICEWKQEI